MTEEERDELIKDTSKRASGILLVLAGGAAAWSAGDDPWMGICVGITIYYVHEFLPWISEHIKRNK